MKKILRCLCVVCTMAFLFSAPAGAGQAPEEQKDSGIPTGVTLEEIGQYPIMEQEDDFTDWGDQVQGMIRSMMFNGSPSIQLLPGGYYVVRGSGDVNGTGLFDENGEQLIPFEAVIIKQLNNHSGEDTGRYLAVYYATEQTDDRTKALIYLSDGSWIGGNNPDEDDVMYLGYIRFYDLKLRRFVPDLTGADFNYSCGDLLVLEKNYTGERLVYNEDGEQIAEGLDAGNGYLIQRKTPREVYDTSLKLRYTTDLKVEVLTSTSGYLKQYVPEEGYQVIDLDGNPVIPDLFKSVSEEKYGIIYGTGTDGEYVLVNVDGQVLARSKKPIFCISAGYYYTEEDGHFALIGYDGVITEGEHRPQNNLQVFDSDSLTDAHTLILNTGKYDLSFGRCNDLGTGLVAVKSSEVGKYGVFGLFAGEQLLDYEYDKISASGGLIYASSDGICHVYKPCWQYR